MVTQRLKQKIRQLEMQYIALLELMPDCLVIIHQDGLITFVNSQTELLFGYAKQEIIGQKIEFLIPNRYVAQHEKHRQAYFKKPERRPMGSGLELYGKHKDGHEIPVDINLSPLETTDGLIVIAAVRDISKHKQLEASLAESERRWKFALENANQGVWDWFVPEGKIYFSHTWKAMLGYQDDEITNEQYEFESRVHPDDLDEMWSCVNAHFEQKTSEYICEVRFRCKDGHYKWVLDRGKVVSRAPDGRVLRAIGTRIDISELTGKEAQLKHLIAHDPLTGLISRALFDDHLAQAIAMTKRHQNKMAVFFLDLDGFKQVNDTYGHAMGDLLLRTVAECLRTCIRDTDTLARFGGDEFLLILTEISEESQVINIAKKMINRVSEGFVIEGKKLTVTLSIGISLYPEDGADLLIEKADSAMYYVKRHGRNNFKLFDDRLKIKK